MKTLKPCTSCGRQNTTRDVARPARMYSRKFVIIIATCKHCKGTYTIFKKDFKKDFDNSFAVGS